MKTRLILIALALLGGLLIAPFGMAPAAHAAAGAAAAPAAGPAPLSPTPVALLMVHGFADTCAGGPGEGLQRQRSLHRGGRHRVHPERPELLAPPA